MVEIKGGTRGGRLCTLAPEKIKFASPVVRLRWSKLELWIPRGSAPGPPPPPRKPDLGSAPGHCYF